MIRLDRKKTKKFKISDDSLMRLVSDDRSAAERYFNNHIMEKLILRYNLLHANNEYYDMIFPKLSKQSKFSSTDVKDIVEWLMPSLTEVYFGNDNIVGVFGRSEQDDPSVLEKVLQYQMRNQNNSYQIIDQWCRDAVEGGLGVVMMTWEHIEKEVKNWYSMGYDEYIALPPEAGEDLVKTVPQPDGSYECLVKELEVVKNQVVLKNIRPGEFIYSREQNADGQYMYEAYRRWVPFNEIVKGINDGVYEKVDVSSFSFDDIDTGDGDSLNTVYEAICNYSDSEDSMNEVFVGDNEGQEARRMVLLFDHYGWYDIDGDGQLEYCHVVTCNGCLLKKEVVANETSPFFTISFYANSYQRWKEAVADYLQCVQDLKTALIRQLIINTSQNNNRQFAIDSQSVQGIDDIIEGRQLIRINMNQNRGINDFIKPMPKYELEPASFQLLEMVSSWAEQKTGITKYNQGLDSDSLNKTATGIVKIMAASQQRLRKMARDGAENGIVPLYRHLIQLDKENLTDEFTFRLTDKYYRFTPDDIKGDFDVQVTSNIGLQDKQLTIQNLMTILAQILPQLMQMGAATPMGMFNTAKQCVQEMGFANPQKYLGIDEEQMAQQTSLPAILEQTLAGLGLPPEITQAAIQNVMLGLQNPNAAMQQIAAMQQTAEGQPAAPDKPKKEEFNDESDGRIAYKDARREALSQMMQ